MNIKELESKRKKHLDTANKILWRISKEIEKQGCFTNLIQKQKIVKRYSKAQQILSGKINSLDFVIGSQLRNVSHSPEVWNFHYNRALS